MLSPQSKKNSENSVARGKPRGEAFTSGDPGQVLCLVQVCMLGKIWRGGRGKRASRSESVVYPVKIGQAVILNLNLARLAGLVLDDSNLRTQMPPQAHLGGA